MDGALEIARKLLSLPRARQSRALRGDLGDRDAVADVGDVVARALTQPQVRACERAQQRELDHGCRREERDRGAPVRDRVGDRHHDQSSGHRDLAAEHMPGECGARDRVAGAEDGCCACEIPPAGRGVRVQLRKRPERHIGPSASARRSICSTPAGRPALTHSR